MTPSSDIDYRFAGGQWLREEFKQQGASFGARFPDQHEARAPYSNWTELIGLIANTVASSRAMLDRMIKA